MQRPAAARGLQCRAFLCVQDCTFRDTDCFTLEVFLMSFESQHAEDMGGPCFTWPLNRMAPTPAHRHDSAGLQSAANWESCLRVRG